MTREDAGAVQLGCGTRIWVVNHIKSNNLAITQAIKLKRLS